MTTLRPRFQIPAIQNLDRSQRLEEAAADGRASQLRAAMADSSDDEREAAAPAADSSDDDDDEQGEPCMRCKLSTGQSEMLVCNNCEAGWHMSCLTPPLTNVPEGKWFCPPCVGLKTHPVAWADELVGKKIEVEWRVIRPADGSGAACPAGGRRVIRPADGSGGSARSYAPHSTA